VSGLAKRARLVMSHASGKVEVVGVTNHHIHMRYHRARNPEDEGRFMTFYRNDHAHWLDDLVPVHRDIDRPARIYPTNGFRDMRT
jgi:hypothetical protein